MLWLTALLLPLYGALAQNYDAVHTLEHAAALAAFAALASSGRFNRTVRSMFVSLGALTAAALLVHVTGGLIEAHFLFFVVIVALTLYEAWLPFLLAVAYVLVHHGVFGTMVPHEVYNHPDALSDPWRWAGVHAFFVALAGAAGLVAWRLNENVRERMRAAQDALESLARTDDLTGLPNRRWLHDELNREFARARRQSLEIRAVMVDLDHFKGFNDRFGHGEGDALLRELANEWRSVLRVSDFLARVGGEEFVVLLPDCSPADAAAVIERLRAATPRGETCSAGIACWDGTETAEELIQRADQMLYRAKAGGRNCVFSSESERSLAPVPEHDALEPRLA